MKALKFSPQQSREILAGKRTSSWRMFDEKDLQSGDEILILSDTSKEPIGSGSITKVRTKTLLSTTPEERAAQGFDDEQRMLDTLRDQFGHKVDWDTEVKIVSFAFLAAPEPRGRWHLRFWVGVLILLLAYVATYFATDGAVAVPEGIRAFLFNQFWTLLAILLGLIMAVPELRKEHWSYGKLLAGVVFIIAGIANAFLHF